MGNNGSDKLLLFFFRLSCQHSHVEVVAASDLL